MSITPIIVLMELLGQSVGRDQGRTKRGKIHEGGEDDDPEVRGIDDVTAIELEEQLELDLWMSESGENANQKAVG